MKNPRKANRRKSRQGSSDSGSGSKRSGGGEQGNAAVEKNRAAGNLSNDTRGQLSDTRRQAGDTRSDAKQPAVKRSSGSRRLRWLLLIAAVLGTGAVIFYLARPAWRRNTSWIESGDLRDDRLAMDRLQTPFGSGGPPLGSASSAHEEIRPLLEEATAVGKRLCERFPGDVRSLGLAAQMQQRMGSATEALRLWKECLQRDPGFIEAYCGIASILIERGENAQAEIALRSALELDPASPQVSVLLANALLNQGKAEETVTVLERGAETGPATMPNFMLRGQAHLQLKQYEEAVQCFHSAVRMAPEFPNAYYGLATASTRLGHRGEAVEYSKKFKELQASELRARIDESKGYDDLRCTRQSVADIYLAIGRLYRAYGDDQAAEDRWVRAAELDPENADSRIDLAQLYLQSNRKIPEAVELAREAIRLGPTPANYFLLATACQRCGELESAAEAIQEALRLDPGNAQYRQMYLLIREKM